MSTRSKQPQAGQNLVEFAILLPIVILILMGVFDLGRVVYYQSTLANAAREGARYAAINPTNTTGITAAVCRLAIGADLGCPSPSSATLNISTVDNYIEVRISYKFSLITPVIGAFFNLDENDQITINTRSRMRIEG